MDQQPTTNNPGTQPGAPTTPIIRDVLGGDEGKTVPVEQALGDSLEKPAVAPPSKETTTTSVPEGFVPPPTTPTQSTPIDLIQPNEEKLSVHKDIPTPPTEMHSEPKLAIDRDAPTLEEDLEKDISSLKLKTESSSEPVVTPIPEKIVEPEPAKRSAIRTLQSDIAGSVRNNNLSLAKIALARQEKTSAIGYVAEEKESFVRRFLNVWSIGAILLIGAGAVIVVGAFIFVQQTNIPLPFIPAKAPAATLVPVDARTVLDVTRSTRAQLIQSINEFTDSDFSSPVAIEALIIEETVGTSTDATPVSIERFFEILGTRAPGRLIRSVGPDMTFGRVGGTPFLITRTNSYENTFDALLEWEEFMAADLPIVTKQWAMGNGQETTNEQEPESLSIAPDPLATTTETGAGESIPVFVPPPPSPTWKDIIVRNKDVRALIDHEGNVLILYAFPKNGYLAIVQNQEALGVIDGALNSPVFGG